MYRFYVPRASYPVDLLLFQAGLQTLNLALQRLQLLQLRVCRALRARLGLERLALFLCVRQLLANLLQVVVETLELIVVRLGNRTLREAKGGLDHTWSNMYHAAIRVHPRAPTYLVIAQHSYSAVGTLIRKHLLLDGTINGRGFQLLLRFK